MAKHKETKEEIEAIISRLKTAMTNQRQLGHDCVVFELQKSIRQQQAKLRRINKKLIGKENLSLDIKTPEEVRACRNNRGRSKQPKTHA